MRVGYIRVSSVDQNAARQLEGVAVDKVFEDKASGGSTNRPQLKAVLDFVREGDVLVVHSLDRLARNAEDLLRTVRELNGRGVTVEFIKDGLTFPPKGGPAAARLLLTVLAAVAEMERALIRERQREGIELAKRRGIYKGGKPKLSKAQVAELHRRAAEPGANKAALAREFGVSRETLYQYLRAGQ